MPELREGIVLALGGGGVRGVAHLGVLGELDAAGIAIGGIAGTSSGALMGALWLLLGVDEALSRLRSLGGGSASLGVPDFGASGHGGAALAPLRRLGHAAAIIRAIAKRHYVSAAEFAARVAELVPDVAIESLRVPFVAVATDSESGDEVWLDDGPLRAALAASSAMPGLTPPVEWRGMRLQDGGAVAEIPVLAARSIGRPVVAVEVSEGMPDGDPDRDRLPKAMFRAAAMGWQALRRRLLAEADAVIAPAVNHLHWSDYGAIDEAVEAGRQAARSFVASRR